MIGLPTEKRACHRKMIGPATEKWSNDQAHVCWDWKKSRKKRERRGRGRRNRFFLSFPIATFNHNFISNSNFVEWMHLVFHSKVVTCSVWLTYVVVSFLSGCLGVSVSPWNRLSHLHRYGVVHGCMPNQSPTWRCVLDLDNDWFERWHPSSTNKNNVIVLEMCQVWFWNCA